MNEINIRFKEMRKKLNLSQKQLGDSLGLSDSGISSIEKGTRNVTDKHIKLLVATFNINEEWLKTGEGTMQLQTDESIIEELANEYHMSDKQKKIIETFARMDESKREIIAQAFFSFIDALAENNNNDVSATVAVRPISSDKKLSKAQKIALMHKQLDEEEKAVTSSASTIISGFGGEKMA